MTTIAWDGKILAADRASWSGSMRYRTRKVYRVRRPGGKIWLVGFSGDASFCCATLKWLRGGPHPGAYPDGKSVNVALVIDEHRRMWRLDSSMVCIPVIGVPHASGGGQECAMGAMLAGASAREAIKIVARCSDMSAFGVDAIYFTRKEVVRMGNKKPTPGTGGGKRPSPKE